MTQGNKVSFCMLYSICIIADHFLGKLITYYIAVLDILFGFMIHFNENFHWYHKIVLKTKVSNLLNIYCSRVIIASRVILLLVWQFRIVTQKILLSIFQMVLNTKGFVQLMRIANEQRKPLIHTSNDLFPHVLSWKVLHSTSFRTWR